MRSISKTNDGGNDAVVVDYLARREGQGRGVNHVATDYAEAPAICSMTVAPGEAAKWNVRRLDDIGAIVRMAIAADAEGDVDGLRLALQEVGNVVGVEFPD